ncbi:hypothetical protein [Sphingobium yanoikuyae]|uniref:hypothetical protein n=1 Tax=Sphingobium yanoikuyae TaxID=13690 RepID=UPI0026F11F74|nr:hypothetical protein [Sphingobium yanoikuyae]
MTADEHIATITAGIEEVERLTRKARKAAVALHATLQAAAIDFKATYGHDSEAMTAAVAPKTPPKED